MKIGYARVSTDEQEEALQVDALNAAGCDRVFIDRGISGSTDPHKRPEFSKAMEVANKGDVLTVWKLDRLGRSQASIIATIDGFKPLGIYLVSLTEQIDTTSPHGRAMWQIIGVFAELERGLIVERTKAGMAAARARGKHVGRPRALNPAQIEHAKTQIENGGTVSGTACLLGVDRSTLRRALEAANG